MKSKLVLVFVLACGGSATPAAETPKPHEETAAEKKDHAWDKLLAEEPKVPYEVASTKGLHAARECGQGPYRIDGKMLGAPYGEEVRVIVCGTHAIAGQSRFTIEGKSQEPQKFGWSDSGNDKCRANATELARAGDAGASTHTTSASAKTTSSKSTGITAEPEKLEDSDVVIADSDDCPKGTHLIHAFGETFSAIGPYPSKQAGAPFRVEIWSAEPNDLKDVTFVLRQRRVEAKMTPEKWTELLNARDAWYARLTAFEKANDMFVHEDAGASIGPPPAARTETQSPKPSVHASWIPGYYHHDGSSWVWVAGFWRVPDEDVKANLTTVAPTAPPPVRDESQERARVVASHDLVWTEGHWQWDGARWVWVEGAWRLPPEQGAVWQAPAWRPRGATFVFVPGGWGRRR